MRKIKIVLAGASEIMVPEETSKDEIMDRVQDAIDGEPDAPFFIEWSLSEDGNTIIIEMFPNEEIK